jgi:hypothetical protein
MTFVYKSLDTLLRIITDGTASVGYTVGAIIACLVVVEHMARCFFDIYDYVQEH